MKSFVSRLLRMLLPFISVTCGEGGAAQFRRDEVLHSMGILRGGRYPSASIYFTNASTKKHVSLIFGDLFHINGIINLIHCADSHGRTRQVLCCVT